MIADHDSSLNQRAFRQSDVKRDIDPYLVIPVSLACWLGEVWESPSVQRHAICDNLIRHAIYHLASPRMEQPGEVDSAGCHCAAHLEPLFDKNRASSGPCALSCSGNSRDSAAHDNTDYK